MKTRALIATLLLSSVMLSAVMLLPDSGLSQSKEQLGTVAFANSCSPAVQEDFLRGVAMLHSFWFSEGLKTFDAVLAKDPTCAIATWGTAALLMSNPLAGAGPSPQWAERAQAAIDQGRKIGAKTPRERDYIEAVAAYFEDWANRPERTRQVNRARAFEALAAKYPTDDEAQIFYALYLSGTQSLADQTYKTYLTAAAVLEKQFEKYPHHPGVAHYLIHSYDAPPIAAKGLSAARRYAAIAPSAPHALHMPSHIFTRVGSWTESIATNERSAAAARRSNDLDETAHAMDYMVYAMLQLGRDADARRVVDEGTRLSGATPVLFVAPYALAAMPARLAVERGDWKAAAALEARATAFPYTDALTHFARGLGSARSGDVAGAEKSAQELLRIRDALKAAKNEYWATEVEVNRLGVAAWTALAQGKRDEALALMRGAADIEDKNEKHIVTPGRILPARELLGQMLLELKRPADAIKEFEASHSREPDRFAGLYGAAQAAAQSGDKFKAKRHYARLVEVAGHSPRPELATARAFLAANP